MPPCPRPAQGGCAAPTWKHILLLQSHLPTHAPRIEASLAMRYRRSVVCAERCKATQASRRFPRFPSHDGRRKRSRECEVVCGSTSQTRTVSEALVAVSPVVPVDRGSDWAERALRTFAEGTRELFNATVQTGSATREAVGKNSAQAVRSLVSSLMGEICGENVVVKGKVRVMKDALLLSRVHVGDDLFVQHIVLRAQLEPMLAALKTWGDVPEGEEAPPVFVRSIHVQGVACKETTVHGILKAYSIFRDCRGQFTIGHLKLVNVEANILYHDEETGEPQYPDTGSSAPKGELIQLRRMEFKDVNSRSPLSYLASTIASYEEREECRAPTTNLLPEGDVKVVLQERRNAQLHSTVKRFGDWMPPALTRTITEASTSSTSLLENLGPILEGNLAGVVGRGSAALIGSAVDVVGVADAGIDVLRAAAGTELVVDTALVLALMAQGLPSWFFNRQGGKLVYRMVETGVASALLKQGNLLRDMVQRQLLERMLSLGLLSLVLDRGDLTRQLIEQGVLKDVLHEGVVEAMLTESRVPILTKLLKGSTLQVIVNTRLFQAVRYHG